MLNVVQHTAFFWLLIAVLEPSSAQAQCPIVPLELARQDARLIISGTAARIEPFEIIPVGGDVVTFAVDAVWKGAAAKTLAFYNWSGVLEGIRISIGTRYLIFAGPIRTFQPRNHEPPTELQVDGCSSKTLEEAEKIGWIRDLGPSHPPQ